jgi:hypothetical protein
MCAYVVGLAIVGELKDATLCAFAFERGRARLSKTWQVAVWLHATFRVHALLSGILAAIPMVILTRGGDALTVAFNTVAILFLTEVEFVSCSPALVALQAASATQAVRSAGLTSLACMQQHDVPVRH